MDKIAQERGLLNKLREKASITGRILESINPEFAEMMDRLRTTDEKIRTQAEGLKDLVRSSKSFIRRRDYLSAAMNISAFHERCRYIAAELDKFKGSVDLKHYKFLLDQFDDEQKEKLFGYDPTRELNTEEISSANDAAINTVITASLEKKAGLSDWWFNVTDPLADIAHNLTNERSIAMRALEKRFSIAFLKDLKNGSMVIVDRTERFLHFLLATFKRLATALAKRNVDQYIRFAQDFNKKFAIYHKLFVDYYNKSIVPLKQQHEKIIEEQRKIEAEKANKLEEQRKSEEEKSRGLEEEYAKRRGLTPITEPAPFGGAPGGPMPQSPTPSAPSGKEIPLAPGEEKLTYEPEEEPFNLTQKKSHEEFVNNIEVFAAKNEPKLLINAILKYSAQIEDELPNESLKLLSIAEGLVEEYKKGSFWDLLKPKNPNEPPKQPEITKEDKPGPLV